MAAEEDILDYGRDARWRFRGPVKILILAILGAVVLTVAVIQSDGSHKRAAVAPTVVPSESFYGPDPRVPRSATYADFGCDPVMCVSGGIPAALRRRLGPGPVASHGCPSAPERVVVSGLGPAGGQGPVYSVSGDPRRHSTFTVTLPPSADSQFAGSRYAAQAIFWLIAPGYRGPVLIRGHRLDGATPVLFSFGGGPLLTDVQLPPVTGSAPHEWRELSIYTRLAAPGCYAWQIDGTNFTYSVPFQVETSP